ncbi:RNA polymerase sigma factor [Rhizobium sp. L1K21]|uniref:RNA polymerase sigma factor n=1 Tax=Rhizobium sp. L1K21 TaxID=2954933 RepID=UPI0020934CB4|nr:RNA polymerase sigma factor [Rhizobium sp. L1K21]MCO6185717.1 RNA polymerase sigma factor [Rhizobium sp. L1K21]
MSRGPDGEKDNTLEMREQTKFEHGMLSLMPSLRRYARSLTRSDADGEDLLQDCVEKALSRQTQWSGSNLKAWTFTIMTNLYRNGIKRAARAPLAPFEDADSIPAENAYPGDPLERRRLAAALDGLAPDFRTVLMLVVVEGMSYRETANLLQIPEGTVMSRLARARRQLAQALQSSNVIPLRRSE